MRDRRLERVEAVVQRQERVAAEGDAGRFLLDRQRGGAWLPRPHRQVGRSAVEGRLRHFATVLGLMPCLVASVFRLS